MELLVAYHGKPEVKEKYLNRVAEHRAADQIKKGFYWEGGKGCAVGCTIHGSDHTKYEKELGVPTVLAILEDRLFEALPNERAKQWPEQFLTAIPVGADLSRVFPAFAVWLLTDPTHGAIQHAKDDAGVSAAIQGIADLFQKESDGQTVTTDEWDKALARARARALALARARALDLALALGRDLARARALDLAPDAFVIAVSEKLLALLASATTTTSQSK